MITGNLIHFGSRRRHDPFWEMERMARHMERLTSAMLGKPGMLRRANRTYPALNITEDNERFFVRAELPGIKADAIDLRLDGRKLAISGERKVQTLGDDVNYHRQEREAGKFTRVVELPADIDADHIEAEMIDGVLKVTLAKSAQAKAKQITVH